MRLFAFDVTGSTKIALALLGSRTYVVLVGGPPSGVGENWARADMGTMAMARTTAPRMFFIYRSFVGKRATVFWCMHNIVHDYINHIVHNCIYLISKKSIMLGSIWLQKPNPPPGPGAKS